MEVDKRQKLLLVVVAVCVLGMGGVWFAFRDTGPSQRGPSDRPAAQKRVREVKDKKPKATKRGDSRKRRKDAQQTLEKRQRDPSERKVLDKKRRKRGKAKQEKKKKIVPAA